MHATSRTSHSVTYSHPICTIVTRHAAMSKTFRRKSPMHRRRQLNSCPLSAIMSMISEGSKPLLWSKSGPIAQFKAVAASLITILNKPHGLQYRHPQIKKSILTKLTSILLLTLIKIPVNTKNGRARLSRWNIRSSVPVGRNRKKATPIEWLRCRQDGWKTGTTSTGPFTSSVSPTPTTTLGSDHGSPTPLLGPRTSSSSSTPRGL